jgi:hypothetical protein
MANLSELPEWTTVTRIEPTTVALGGDEINSPNKQLKELVDRTAYLKQQLETQPTIITNPLFSIYNVEVFELDGDKYRVVKIPKPPSIQGFTTLYKNITVEVSRLSEQIDVNDILSAQLYVLDSATSEGTGIGNSFLLPVQWREGIGFYSKHNFIVETPVDYNVNEKNLVLVNDNTFTLPSDLVYYQGLDPYLKVLSGESAYVVLASPTGYTSTKKFYYRIWYQGVRLSQQQSELI